ncbi:MAG: hypothetical protein HY649_02720 [Acidobacteria bacterium]|nr:hypothetical protein [Acidobacteriota bacterium]
MGTLLRRQNRVLPTGAFIAYAAAKNEADSLDPLCSSNSNCYLAGRGGNARNDFPLLWSYLLCWIYLPLVIKKFRQATGNARRLFSYNFDGYLHTYGLYITSRIWLRSLKPRALILANQVAVSHRVILKVAHEEGIPTIYLPHSTVSDVFPPLRFTYALLEGRDALRKYVKAGPTTTIIFLVGIPKFDPYFQDVNLSQTVESVGICTSSLDSMAVVQELCEQMRRSFPSLGVILRPHPSDRRTSGWSKLASRCGLQWSDPMKEHPFVFLKRVDVMVAGNSNILLEGILMNVVALMYDFDGTGLDWYGFARNGLVPSFYNPQQVVEYIDSIRNSRPAVRMKAKPYCATVGTRFDGRSAELVQGLIQKLVSGGITPSGVWRRIPDIPVTVYELDGIGEPTEG